MSSISVPKTNPPFGDSLYPALRAEVVEAFKHEVQDPNALVSLHRYQRERHLNHELFHFILLNLQLHRVGNRNTPYLFIKRVCDFSAALVLLVLASPLLVALAILVRISSPGPVLFRQLRIGQYMRPFWIYKFRTMTIGSVRTHFFVHEADAVNPKPRLTPFGGFMRDWSLDELPQLLNVLRGAMSLIGPRPLTPEDSSTTDPEFYMRFACKPGMSGYWQAIARHSPDGKGKVRLDSEYAKRQGFWFDLSLLLLTPISVISRHHGSLSRKIERANRDASSTRRDS